MNYQMDIWFRQQGEWDCMSESFQTLDECCDYFYGHFVDPIRHLVADVKINDKKVRVNNGRLVGGDMEPFCTNAKWHEIFAPVEYPRINPRIAVPSKFKPRTPTNPATLIAVGAL